VLPEELLLFSHQDVLTELIRKKDIHSGRWALVFKLQLAASNVNALKEGADKAVLTPAGMILIEHIGIYPTNDVNDLTLDAAEVNPPRRKSRRRSKKSAK
jgi:hypothetical protein